MAIPTYPPYARTIFTDELGGVVDDSGIESCVGGLLVTEADAAEAIPQTKATMVLEEDDARTEDDKQQEVAHVAFYNAVVAVHPSRVHAGFGIKDTQLHESVDEPSLENEIEEESDFEDYTQSYNQEEDLDNEDMEEITVYEVEEISTEMVPREVIIEEKGECADQQCFAIVLPNPEIVSKEVTKSAIKNNRPLNKDKRRRRSKVGHGRRRSRRRRP